jgi:hypothetical protein
MKPSLIMLLTLAAIACGDSYPSEIDQYCELCEAEDVSSCVKRERQRWDDTKCPGSFVEGLSCRIDLECELPVFMCENDFCM